MQSDASQAQPASFEIHIFHVMKKKIKESQARQFMHPPVTNKNAIDRVKYLSRMLSVGEFSKHFTGSSARKKQHKAAYGNLHFFFALSSESDAM